MVVVSGGSAWIGEMEQFCQGGRDLWLTHHAEWTGSQDGAHRSSRAPPTSVTATGLLSVCVTSHHSRSNHFFRPKEGRWCYTRKVFCLNSRRCDCLSSADCQRTATVGCHRSLWKWIAALSPQAENFAAKLKKLLLGQVESRGSFCQQVLFWRRIKSY